MLRRHASFIISTFIILATYIHTATTSILVMITRSIVLLILVRRPCHVLPPGESRWVCAACNIKDRKKVQDRQTGRQTGGRHTDALHLPLDATTVINNNTSLSFSFMSYSKLVRLPQNRTDGKAEFHYHLWHEKKTTKPGGHRWKIRWWAKSDNIFSHFVQ